MHVPVLLKEAIDILNLKAGGVYLDATLGAGGHTEEVFKRLGNSVVVAGIDADPLAVDAARVRLELAGAHTRFATLNFRHIPEALTRLEIENPTAILMDLGWNKSQFDTPEGMPGRGFSFQKDEPLLMTFGDSSTSEFTAMDIVNTWDAENIETILDAYGEEKLAWKIAHRIVEAREKGEIKTSRQLAEIIYYSVPMWYRFKKIHPATRTFQALRIAVNDELRTLQNGLQGSFEILKPGGVLAVISFHSLEDRIVKQYFKELSIGEKAELLTKKPLVPSDEESEQNPRSRSAKLRAIRKI